MDGYDKQFGLTIIVTLYIIVYADTSCNCFGLFPQNVIAYSLSLGNVTEQNL